MIFSKHCASASPTKLPWSVEWTGRNPAASSYFLTGAFSILFCNSSSDVLSSGGARETSTATSSGNLHPHRNQMQSLLEMRTVPPDTFNTFPSKYFAAKQVPTSSIQLSLTTEGSNTAGAAT